MATTVYWNLGREGRRFNDSLKFVPGRKYHFRPPVLAGEPPIKISVAKFLHRRQNFHDFAFAVGSGREGRVVYLCFGCPSDLPRDPWWYRRPSLRHLVDFTKRWVGPKRSKHRLDFVVDAWYRFPEPLVDIPTLVSVSGVTIDEMDCEKISFSEAQFVASIIDLNGQPFEFIFRAKVEGKWQYVSLGFSDEEPPPELVVGENEFLES